MSLYSVLKGRYKKENRFILKSINVFNVLEGEKYWKDPEKFDPDRFLDEVGHLKVPEAFIPFSIGKK